MEDRALRIYSQKNKKIFISVIPGHFATTHSHINYYIDMTGIKHQQKMAKMAAEYMAQKYMNAVLVDTIICMDGCEVIGALLADELSRAGFSSMNAGSDINVITPEYDPNGQLIFRDNVQKMIWNKNVILLVASATTGKTINRSLECIKYYGGKVVGTSAIFSAISEKGGVPVDAIFTTADISGYGTYPFEDCPLCREKQRIDAIINSFGYSKI